MGAGQLIEFFQETVALLNEWQSRPVREKLLITISKQLQNDLAVV